MRRSWPRVRRARRAPRIEAAHQAALAQYGPQHPFTLRAALALAHVAAGEGNLGAARTQLVGVIAGLRAAGARATANLADALESLGEVELARREPQAAVAPLEEAVALDGKSAPAGYELALARERLAEAGRRPGTWRRRSRCCAARRIRRCRRSSGPRASRDAARARRAQPGRGGAGRRRAAPARAQPPPCSSRNSQARAFSQSRCTVRSDRPSARAVSASL